MRFSDDLRFYVYTLADPRDGRVFYVGKGCGLRIHSHVGVCRDWIKQGRSTSLDWGNLHKLRKIAQIIDMGLGVVHKTVCEGLSEKEALGKECNLISEIGLENLTNLTSGGESPVISEETRFRMSESHRGKTQSEETCRRRSESLKGRVFPREHIEKLRVAALGNTKGRGHKRSEKAKEASRAAAKANWASLTSEQRQDRVAKRLATMAAKKNQL